MRPIGVLSVADGVLILESPFEAAGYRLRGKLEHQVDVVLAGVDAATGRKERGWIGAKGYSVVLRRPERAGCTLVPSSE